MVSKSSQDTIDLPEQHGATSVGNKLPSVIETETTPLLGRVSTPPTETASSNETPRMSSRTILMLMGVLVLIIQCGSQFQLAPTTRIFESIYCYQYWEEADPSKILIPRSAARPGAIGGVEEHWCKVSQVQGKVAMLQGTQQSLDSIPSLILAIPIGILADRWGRRPFWLVGLFAFPLSLMWQMLICWFWQSFNLRLVWLSSLHALIGGGSPVVSALFFVVLSDVTNQENRSGILLKIFSANLLSNFICPPIAAYFMTINPWIPMFLGLACLTAGIPIAIIVPETLGYQDSAVKTNTEHVDEEDPGTSKGHVKDFLGRCFQPLLESGVYFMRDKRIIVLVVMFPLVVCTFTNVPLLLQYASTRYDMTFSKATFLVSIKAGFTVFMFLAIQPWISYLLTKSGMSGQQRDLVLVRGSAILMFLGWIAVGFAPNTVLFILALVVSTLGNGFPVFLRSFLTGLVEPNKVAELYTAIGLIDTLGTMLGSPLLAWLFQCGLKLGGMGIGLPFIVLGLGYGAAVVGLFQINHAKRSTAQEAEEHEPCGE